MRVASSAFRQGEAIPRRFTCDGENISPDFAWHDAPKETKSFALIIHDPDAHRKDGFTHWVLYNIPPGVTELREGAPKDAEAEGFGVQGKNDSGKSGYTGPCPPSGNHRYFVRVFALREELDLDSGADAKEVQRAMENVIIEQAELMGTYQRSQAKSA
jgi:hypothetical protein